MTIQTITKHPHQELFTKLVDIDKKDIKSETFTQIGSSMLEILRKKGGIGLSANQVGLKLRMCVIELDSNNPMIIINPRIVKMSDKMVNSQEGCLSLPGATAKISRHAAITVEYETVTGDTITQEATGLLSCCLQHEIDHLNDILMLNRLNELHKSRFLKGMSKYRRSGRLK